MNQSTTNKIKKRGGYIRSVSSYTIENWKLIICITIFCFWSNNASAATIAKPNNYLLQSGLVGWWTFDRVDMTPNVRDKSGSGKHGNLIGQTSTTTTIGKLGQGIIFDGNDDYVDVGNNLSVGSALSVSMWVNIRKGGTNETLIDKNDEYALYFLNNNLVWKVGTTSATNASVSFTNKFNQWHVVTGVWDGVSASLWLDGVLIGTDINYSSVPTANALFIGQNSPSHPAGNTVDGSLDDVRIYNRALSASEIAALYKLGGSKVAGTPTAGSTSLGGLNSGLVGYWTFDVSDVNWQSGAISNRGSSTYPAYLFGMSTTTSPRSGRSGQSLYFDGSSSFARTELIDNTHFISALDQPHSMFAWVYRSATTSNMSIVSYGEFDDLSLSTGIGIIGGKFAWIRNGVTTYTLSPFGVPVDRWTFVGVVRTSGSLTTFYMNASSTVVSGSISNAVDASDPFTIGSAYRNAIREGNFLGRIDDVRVYNRNVSSVEAQQLYVIGATKLGVSTPTGSSLSSGLVGHWTFDGKDMGPNVRDQSGQGNHGNLIGQTSTTTAIGKIGQALLFDGVNDVINAGSASSLDNLSQWTACAWVYIRSASSPIDVLTKTNALDGAWYLYFDYNGANSSFQAYQDYDVTGAYASSQNGVIRFNQWAYVCSRFDTSDSQDIRLYINGSEVASYLESGNASGNKIDDSTRNIGIGANVTNSSRYFNGLIDDVRLYNRALLASEIQQLYLRGR